MADETDIEDSLSNRAYNLARAGMTMPLFSFLNNKDEQEIDSIINKHTIDEDGQRLTPLIIAAKNGHYKVVKMMIEKFKPDLEVEATVKFDGSVIEGASALWCAAGSGHLRIVKMLIMAGADVNHCTNTYSTPLRAACFYGHYDLVRYLTDHNADINIPNKYNNTCLMIASYKGYFDIVHFLLSKGAHANKKALCGATALHFAAESGNRNIVLELLENGATVTKNGNGMTPILAAAERTHDNIVEAFVEHQMPKLTKEEIIEAYELLGASYANDKEHYSLVLAHHYMYKAMELRFSDPDNIVRKNLNEPIKAYEYWKESESLERLANIEYNDNAIHMEALTIRQRILGLHNPELPHPIVYRGAVFADNARFDRCIELWLYALQLRQLNNIPVVKDLLRFAQVFSQMIHVGVDLMLEQVLDVLEASIIELTRNKAKLKKVQDPKDDDFDQSLEESQSYLMTTLYLLTILAKLMALNGGNSANNNNNNPASVRRAHLLVHKVCALGMTLQNGYTLLHLAVNDKTPVDDFHINDVCKFPCAATAKLLIECGADVNAMDNKRNTPLHVIVTYQKPISDFMTMHCIILGLIDAGAHTDTVNSRGKTPFDAATTGVAEIILKAQTKISLQCLAAKVVKAYGLSYSGNVPRSLESFIELHGSGLKQG